MTSILFEDNHLIVVVKKSGQPVQPEVDKPLSLEEEVKHYIKVSKQKPGDVFLGVIHRLDMPVSGIVLFAKTSKALVRMNAIFQKREVTKEYTAIVEGIPTQKDNKLSHYLRRDDTRRITKAFDKEVPDSQLAELSYSVMKVEKGNAVLKVLLHTGRKHQIRSQLSAIGHPIVGDIKYKATQARADFSIALYATYLSFVHPVTKSRVEVSWSF